MNNLQNLTNYKPTEKEKALLEVLINPENRMKSITDICKLAKCSRPVYYEAFSKSGFVEIYKQQSMDLVKQSVASVLNTFIREAQRGSFQHGKVLLEMAGIYTEKQQLEHSGNINANNPYEGLTKEQLLKLASDEE
ncbi:phBC6A51 family helix-turn-helix protein [Tissierella praeacuta]|uniref:phBC6A51 family helix-turn-helix protein n=1 Tax=Tissierella praeacuta TaxID=43131 RepID=UPI003DA2315F